MRVNDTVEEVVGKPTNNVSEDEFIEKIRDKKAEKVRVGESGFDVVFENGYCIETYDMCLIMRRMAELAEKLGSSTGTPSLDCTPYDEGFHKTLAFKFLDKTVKTVEYNTDSCIFKFVLNDGETVCIPDQYGYVLTIDGDSSE